MTARKAPQKSGTERPMDSKKPSGGTDIFHFSEQVLEVIDDSLVLMLDESNARCALVIDRTGCIIASSGDFHPIGQEVMGATAAGIVAALNSMVARASSPEVSVRLYGSDLDNIHFLVVADRLILCILYSRRTTSGRVRASAKTFSQRITPLIEQERGDTTSPERLVQSVRFIEDKLNDMFKDLI